MCNLPINTKNAYFDQWEVIINFVHYLYFYNITYLLDLTQ